MNPYHFIFYYVQTFWSKRKADARLHGQMAVFFTVLMHVLLLVEVIWDLTGIQLLYLPDLPTYGQRKSVMMLCLVPFLIPFFLYFSKTKAAQINDHYESRGLSDAKQLTWFCLVLVLPFVLLVLLSVLRQNGII
ncbi:hypothetical protein [Polluticoccus soli]|uniref:hypothetical protein n=1 Tax=Polluticoccus soli TaxID=3034150 RepID=UPI0023E0A24C|nr:hypothetical protein [Flavipsychrobacter sp. JY13-12]